MLVPLATNLLILAGVTPYGIDLGPFAVAVSGLLFGWAMKSRRMLDLLPVARERALECLADGLVILDTEGRVADFNPAAPTVLGLGPHADRDEVQAALAQPELAALSVAGEGSCELSLAWGGGVRRVKARVFPVTDGRGRTLGSSLIVADVTELALLVDRLAELASLDGLTGALNRRHLDEIDRGNL